MQNTCTNERDWNHTITAKSIEVYYRNFCFWLTGRFSRVSCCRLDQLVKGCQNMGNLILLLFSFLFHIHSQFQSKFHSQFQFHSKFYSIANSKSNLISNSNFISSSNSISKFNHISNSNFPICPIPTPIPITIQTPIQNRQFHHDLDAWKNKRLQVFFYLKRL